MKRKTLIGITIGVVIGIAALVNLSDKKINVPLPTSEAKYVAEFVDRNNNRQFDGYRVIKITRGIEEYVTSHYHSWLSPEDAKDIYFHTPFGGTMQGEFDKEYLKSVYNNLGYPEVDEIRFIE